MKHSPIVLPRPEYPRPQFVRSEWLNLNGEWEFAFDAHACLWEPRQAVDLGNALAPNEPLFLEEPIRPEHIPSWARIRSELRVPLATGESLYTPHEFLALLTVGGADIVQPDICVVGGLTQLTKIAEAHYPHCPGPPGRLDSLNVTGQR